MSVSEWYHARRDLPDGRVMFVVPRTYGKAQLTIGRGENSYDHGY